MGDIFCISVGIKMVDLTLPVDSKTVFTLFLASQLCFEVSGSQVLDEKSLDGIVKYIQNKNSTKLVVLTGAGISTAAGIPDFNGLTSLHPDNDISSVFEMDFFLEHPDTFYRVIKDLYPLYRKPTLCHYFIRLLQEKGRLLRQYTTRGSNYFSAKAQTDTAFIIKININVDTLERLAGMQSDKLVEVRGTLYTSTCVNCSAPYELEWMEKKIFLGAPRCEKCGGIVKPDIEFSGVGSKISYDDEECLKDFRECDLLIAMGNTLSWSPFQTWSTLHVPADRPRLLINKQCSNIALHRLAAPAELAWILFDPTNNGTRDVFWKGNCDDGCQLLANKLGWTGDLRELVDREHERIDERNQLITAKY